MTACFTSSWAKEAKAVAVLNPELAGILDEVAKAQASPQKKVTKLEFAFGDPVLVDGHLALPDLFESQNMCFGIVLEHSLEAFVHVKNDISPLAVLEPGQTFVLNTDSDLSLIPLPLLNIYAGARSIFLLPKINHSVSFFRLAHHCHLKEKHPPQSIRDHWAMFTEMAKQADSSWRATVLLFDHSWLKSESFHGYRLHRYLSHTNLPNPNFFRKKLIFDMILAETVSELRFKPDAFLVENIKHLFAIACHFVPGFVFAEDESLAPIQFLQEAFMEHYGLHYMPSILQPGYAQKGRPCYHSLQHPAFLRPAIRRQETNLEQIRELYRVLYKVIERIQEVDPIQQELIEFLKAQLEFFHMNATDKKHREVEPITEIQTLDPIIQRQLAQFATPFSDASAFLRKGCISVISAGKSL